MNDTLMPFSYSSGDPNVLDYADGYDYPPSVEMGQVVPASVAVERDPVAFVVDVTAALSPADAFRILEGVLHGMVQQMEAQNAAPPKNCPVGVDCGTLVLTPKLLQKMVVILRKYQCTLAMVYARLPQTQQAALGMGMLVREVPERSAAFNIHEWVANEQQARSAAALRPSLSDRSPEKPATSPTMDLATPIEIPSLTEGVISAQAPEWQELAPAPMSESYQALPTEFVGAHPEVVPAPAPAVWSDAEGVAETPALAESDSFYQQESLPAAPIPPAVNAVPATPTAADEMEVAPVTASVAAQPTLETPVPEKFSDHSRPMEMTMLPAGVSPELVAAHTLPTRLVQGSLRSGQTVASDGHLVVLGDVHGGSEIVAAGHIVVWGELRGVAHAGALVTPSGDVVSAVSSSQALKTLGEGASIRALSIRAVQLRIGRYIARRPDRVDNHKPERPLDADTPVRPEMAKVVDREIRIYESLA